MVVLVVVGLRLSRGEGRKSIISWSLFTGLQEGVISDSGVGKDPVASHTVIPFSPSSPGRPEKPGIPWSPLGP